MPIIFAIVGLLMIFLSYRKRTSYEEAYLKRSLMFYFILMAIMWSGIFLYFFFPYIFHFVLPVQVFCALSAPVALYRFIECLTLRQTVRVLRSPHYLPALTFSIFTLIAVFFSPVPLIELDEYISSLLLLGYFLSSTFYFILTNYLLYKRNLELQSLNPEFRLIIVLWMVLLEALVFILLFSAVIPCFLPKAQYIRWGYAGAVLISMQFAILIYNMVCNHYLIFEDTSRKPREKYSHIPSVSHIPAFELKRLNFEEYFVKNKLYTDPDISLNDLVIQMGTDQPTLSAFIQKNYHMNFRQYLNNLRMEELERLLSLPVNAGKKPADFIVQAGFGSLRSYQRCRKIEQERQMAAQTEGYMKSKMKKDGSK
jgi:AraC-like DNA-binding protein